MQEAIAFFRVETAGAGARSRAQERPLYKSVALVQTGRKSGKGVKLSLPGVGDGEFERY